MKIGMNTDSLGALAFDAVLDTAVELKLSCVEFATGNWSGAPHIDIDALLASAAARDTFVGKVRDRGLTISALTCNGNSLHPGPSGREHDAVIRKSIELAPMIDVERIILMSGCPGAKGDKHPNWITVAWPPETTAILEWQWNDVLIPYWRDLVAFANGKGVRQLCLEMHGGQNVYNVETLFRLRAAAGETVGANFDPSHLIWMGADPIAAIEALGSAIFHVHAKDTRIDGRLAGLNSRIETKPASRASERSWNYVTLGYGEGEDFWRAFCLALRRAGYDGVLSLEHEDMMLSPLEGMRKSVDLLSRVMMVEPASYKLAGFLGSPATSVRARPG